MPKRDGITAVSLWKCLLHDGGGGITLSCGWHSSWCWGPKKRLHRRPIWNIWSRYAQSHRTDDLHRKSSDPKLWDPTTALSFSVLCCLEWPQDTCTRIKDQICESASTLRKVSGVAQPSLLWLWNSSHNTMRKWRHLLNCLWDAVLYNFFRCNI